MDFSIQSTEYVNNTMHGTYRWQFLDLHGTLNISSFRASGLDYNFPTQLGDVLITTYPDGGTFLFIDVGRDEATGYRAYHMSTINIKLNPQETIDYGDEISRQATQELLADYEEQFGMTLQYTSENFYWYSNAADSRLLPDLVAGVEGKWGRLMEVFEPPSQRINICFFDFDDLAVALKDIMPFLATADDWVARNIWPGNALWSIRPDLNTVVSSGPRGRTSIDKLLIDTTVHEVAHVLQTHLINWDRMGSFTSDWVIEGSANFLAGNVDPLGPELRSAVQRNDIPTLDKLETPGLNTGDHSDYNFFSMASASIFQFIADIYGMEYIADMYRYPDDIQRVFGISRAEFERQWHLYLRLTLDPPQSLNTTSPWARSEMVSAIIKGFVPANLQDNYQNIITRAEFAALAVKFFETVTGTEITERRTFADTNDINVEKAAGIRVVTGIGNNRFNPNGQLTREEAATMLSRLANALEQPLPNHQATFSDAGSVSSWATIAVGQMQASGVMTGSGNRFSPHGPYTREQSIATILRLFDIVT